jgi:hypothetical protein
LFPQAFANATRPAIGARLQRSVNRTLVVVAKNRAALS